MEWVKIVTTVPVAQADALRKAVANAGAGVIGNYTDCSFSLRGTGRFKALPGANPAVGKVGGIQEVEEEQIWWSCEKEKVGAVVDAIRAAHPYEEVIIDVYPVEKV